MKILTALAVAALFLAGCAKKNDTPEAIRQGVIRDLASKFDIAKMDVIVDSVSFRDKEADATVTFAVKGGSADQGMKMSYVMERRDDNLWYIKSRASAPTAAGSAGADGGTGAPALPPGHPGMDGSTPAAGGASLPPGHPATGQNQ